MSAISWREHVNFQWDDEEVRFVLDQHAKLDFYSASSLKQQSDGRHVAPLGHIILIPSRVFAHSPLCRVLSREATNTNFIVFGSTRLGLEPMIYHTQGEHEPMIYHTRGEHEPMIYHTRGEHNPWSTTLEASTTHDLPHSRRER